MTRLPPCFTFLPYTTRPRSSCVHWRRVKAQAYRLRPRSSTRRRGRRRRSAPSRQDRKSTSELQSHLNLVCRLLLEKKKTQTSEENRALYVPSSTKHATPISR